jgi:hypothetical protein
MKKRIVFPIILFIISINTAFAQINLSLTTGFGATAVDVEKAIKSDQLEDWNTFSYSVIVAGEKKVKDNLSVAGEFGWQQLYYWEEYYLSTSGYRYFRWGDVATIILGGTGRLHVNEKFSVFSGLNIRIFTDESGITPGIPFGGEYIVFSKGKIDIPVGLRTDIVFGNAVPIVFNIFGRLRYNL